MSGHRQFTYEQVAAAFLYLPDTGKLYRRLSDGGLRPMTMVRENRDRVELSVEGCKVRCGSYATVEEANAVARAKRAELHGEWSFEASRG